jgi:signal transduction histidine kinase
MLERLASLRLWLVCAMLGTTLTGLALTYAIVHSRGGAATQADRRKSALVAAAVASEAARGASVAQLAQAQRLLPNDRLIVVRRGRVVFRGPRRSAEVEHSTTRPFPGGRVTIVDHETTEAASSATPAVVAAAAVAAALIVVATIVATVITRSVTDPLRRAVAVSDRLASGDFTARMGATGPEALSRLGEAVDDMAERLEHQERDRRRLVADIVHEIATPVSTIVGYATALGDGTARSPDHRAAAGAAIARAAARLNDLLAGLRDLTRLDFGDAAVAPTDLRRTAAATAHRLAPLADAAGLDVRLALGSCHATTRPGAVETVLENLLTNAFRYTPGGGAVTLTTRETGADAVITVADTGKGIHPDEQDKIFDALYRSDSGRSRATGGAGLGLSIARRAAHAIGARLTVQSTPGEGSTFTLSVPRTAPRTGPAETAEHGSARS